MGTCAAAMRAAARAALLSLMFALFNFNTEAFPLLGEQAEVDERGGKVFVSGRDGGRGGVEHVTQIMSSERGDTAQAAAGTAAQATAAAKLKASQAVQALK